MEKTVKFLMILLLGVAIVSASCKKKEPAPDLPPESTFVMDFTNFSNANDTLNKSNATYQNWGHSYANAAFWNVVIAVGLAVPVASFRASFNQKAVYSSKDKEWSWTYTVKPVNVDHTCKLTASITGDYVQWKMFITKNNHYTNFMWYEGQSHLDGTNGYWKLYESPTVNVELLQIDWNDNLSGIADIKYTNIKPGGPENGGYIHYGITNESPFDDYYNIYNKGQNNLTEILFHRTNKNGKVKDFKHFNDNEWHCWDTSLADVDC